MKPIAQVPQNTLEEQLVITSSVPQTLFATAWISVNVLLVVSCFFTLYSVTWEFSTQRYLKGFSDAIVPATAPGEEKIEAILAWMVYGPTRLPYSPSTLNHDRDPTDTLNYDALLRVCGTATNAFINLANSGGLPVRRLLLLDSHQSTKHVVAEVLVDGRWIVVDPAYRMVFRDANGQTVTREELLSLATFSVVTQRIPHYPAEYTFDNTVHLRLAGISYLGKPIRIVMNHILPGWEDSALMTLLVERESFAAVVASILFLIFTILLRIMIRWYGERRLRIQPIRFRERMGRAASAFLTPPPQEVRRL
jgi:Transglutaminase-like superfamily